MTATTPYSVKLSGEGSRSEILFPHFTYPAYSGAGLPNPWYIARCLEAGRVLSMAYGFIRGNKLVEEGATFVILKADYVFRWDLLSSAHRRTYFPFKVVVSLKRVGKTSMVWHHDMINMLDHQILASLDAQMVHIDRKTRRGKPFPDWFTEKYQRFNEAEARPRMIIPEVSPLAFSLPMTIMSSSIDYNAHLNNSEIIRISLDCVAAASGKNHFRFVKGDVRALWLTQLKVYYMKEGLVDDVLTVSTWEGETPGDICTLIKRDNDILSFHMLTFDIVKHSRL